LIVSYLFILSIGGSKQITSNASQLYTNRTNIRTERQTVDCNSIPGYSTHRNRCGYGTEVDNPIGCCYFPYYYACFPAEYTCCGFEDIRIVFEGCPGGKNCHADGCLSFANITTIFWNMLVIIIALLL